MPATPTRDPAPASSSSRVYVELPASRSSGRASPRISTSTPRQTRARTQSATPSHSQSQPHSPAPHLSRADELAAEEAEKIMGSMEGSARSRRHEKLSRLREQTPDDEEEEEEVVDTGSVDHEEERDLGKDDEHVFDGSRGVEGGDDVSVQGIAGQDVASAAPNDALPEATIKAGSASVTADDDDAPSDAESSVVSSTSGSSSVSSDSDSESDSDSDDEDEDEDDSESDEDAELERLLQSARLEAVKSAQATGGIAADGVAGGHDVVSFDIEDQAGTERRRKEAPIPDIAITKMPKPHLSFTANGTAKASTASAEAGPSRPTSKGKQTSVVHAPELDDQPYERQLSKREKAAQPKKASATELWSTLPAPKADLLPQMKKDYQALSLANSLDPKRFMKGGSRSGKIPDRFAIGTMVEAPRQLQDTTLSREKQYRPGQIVQDLVRDDSTGSYAKRKYGDLQKTRMDNGRGRGWKKQRGW